MSTNVDRTLYTRAVRPPPSSGEVTRYQRRVLVAPTTLEKTRELALLALGVLEGLFAIRFALKLLGANPDNAFASLVYSVTDLFLRPFQGLIATPQADGMVLELTTVVAMVVYALAFWVVGRATLILLRGSAEQAVALEVRETSAHTQDESVQDSAALTAAGWRRDF